ncbi:uncharacterized protein HKW66_Vig0084510 [Vigna angularis]|uniref:Uncharacterized protein n=1 Tax=Phaseolus angularis TaxID=3914 RepID=A0A8T0KGP1_PHAAN|nr:uncharacterized protein HKW66_Vig0084510 [Vigna angularis]
MENLALHNHDAGKSTFSSVYRSAFITFSESNHHPLSPPIVSTPADSDPLLSPPQYFPNPNSPTLPLTLKPLGFAKVLPPPIRLCLLSCTNEGEARYDLDNGGEARYDLNVTTMMEGIFRSVALSKRRIQSNALIVGASSNSTSSSTLSDDLVVDLSRVLRGWSVIAKTGRISSSYSKSDSGLEEGDEIETQMQEVVYELMLLARGSSKCEQEVGAYQIQEHPFNNHVWNEHNVDSVSV